MRDRARLRLAARAGACARVRRHAALRRHVGASAVIAALYVPAAALCRPSSRADGRAAVCAATLNASNDGPRRGRREREPRRHRPPRSRRRTPHDARRSWTSRSSLRARSVWPRRCASARDEATLERVREARPRGDARYPAAEARVEATKCASGVVWRGGSTARVCRWTHHRAALPRFRIRRRAVKEAERGWRSRRRRAGELPGRANRRRVHVALVTPDAASTRWAVTRCEVRRPRRRPLHGGLPQCSTSPRNPALGSAPNAGCRPSSAPSEISASSTRARARFPPALLAAPSCSRELSFDVAGGPAATGAHRVIGA